MEVIGLDSGMVDIGSIFSISASRPDAGNACFGTCGNMVLYALCREALLEVAGRYAESCRSVLLPAYTCSTVAAPFEQLGWKIRYYGISSDLRIDVASLLAAANDESPSLVVAHPYYGAGLNDEERGALRKLGDNGADILEDVTQCLFLPEEPDLYRYRVGSLRKWFAIPDGGFLVSYDSSWHPRRPKEEFREFSVTLTKAMLLRGEYFRTGDPAVKQESIRLSKVADSVSNGPIEKHSISEESIARLAEADPEECASARLRNYRFLHKGFEGKRSCRAVRDDAGDVATAPLYFPAYASDRDGLQRFLAGRQIYAPLLWPMRMSREEAGGSSYIYDNILAIPCDQRYLLRDMARIVDAITEYEARSMSCEKACDNRRR